MSDVIIVEDRPMNDGELMADVPSRVISSVLGLMGFFTACLVGLSVGNPGSIILVRAMLALAVCAVIGRVIGTVGEVCVREFVVKYKADRPMPEMPEELQELYDTQARDEALRDRMKQSA